VSGTQLQIERGDADSEGVEVTIRPPLARNLFTISFGALWCSGLASVGTSFVRDGLWFIGLLPLSAAGLGALMFWRIASASVKTSERGLHVRNVLHTVQVPWSSVDDIRIARRGVSWRRGLELVLNDGQTVSVDVLSGNDAQPGLIAGKRLDAAQAQLRDRHQRLA
jgi:hypothetical protein